MTVHPVVYPVPLGRVLASLRQALSQSETIDVLLRKAVSILNAAYAYDSMIWVGIEQEKPDTCGVYSTKQRWDAFTQSNHQEVIGTDDEAISPSNTSRDLVRRFRPKAIPLWLVALCGHPQMQCLDTGDLILPICDDSPLNLVQSEGNNLDSLGDADSSQDRRSPAAAQHPGSPSPPAVSPIRFVLHVQHRNQSLPGQPPYTNWRDDEVNALQTIGYHILLACDALAIKRRLEQSQRHASLLSRTAHVLNTSVNLDRAIQGVLAEMGQAMRCDRLLLFDFRQQSVAILATWERPRQRLTALTPDGLAYALWQDTIDLFLQGGASHLEFRMTEPDADPLQGWLNDAGTGSALLLPVFIREDFFGAIALLSSRHDRQYSVDELQMARQNTDQVSIALALIQSNRTSTPTTPSTIGSSSVPLSSASHPLIDPITTLPNSDAFERELNNLSTSSAWALRTPFSLVVCDIDYFKLVNDTHGVDLGDRVLQRIARKLQHLLRRDTLIYRYGGEEFAIILQDTDQHTAKDVAERLRQSIRAMPLRTTSDILTVTLSFGVAQLQPEGDRHAIDVLRRAERALLEAKRQGRDRVAVG